MQGLIKLIITHGQYHEMKIGVFIPPTYHIISDEQSVLQHTMSPARHLTTNIIFYYKYLESSSFTPYNSH